MSGTKDLASSEPSPNQLTNTNLSTPSPRTYCLYQGCGESTLSRPALPWKHEQIESGQVPMKRVSNRRAHWG